MAFKCDNCNKGIMYGHNVSHSKRRTNRVFKPNLQKKTIMIGHVRKQVKLCTNCIKLMGKIQKDTFKAQAALAEASNVSSAN
ncbi:MAG TPA: 50S ribosomal protein L28 [Candidatus Levybacteria bacterium]|nr:50S ribosomal protein L28 [Candidatus Levybacteria bacterium]